MSGEAERDVETFLNDEDHTLDDYKVKIQHYRELALEIAALDDVVIFHMFVLECHDIKRGLIELAQNLISSLVQHLAERHIAENTRYLPDHAHTYMQYFTQFTYRICSEYELFRTQALKVPDDSREMMDMIAYIEKVKTEVIQDQWEAVKASMQRLIYLLDLYNFTPEEMEQNQLTLTWPKKLAPIFEENEMIIEASKVLVTTPVRASRGVQFLSAMRNEICLNISLSIPVC